jgi:drug/metabolite transporter (DMT)-like permease
MLLPALIWGGSFLSNRLALDEVGVFTTVAFRVSGACAILWVWVTARGLAVPRSWRVWAAFGVMGDSSGHRSRGTAAQPHRTAQP